MGLIKSIFGAIFGVIGTVVKGVLGIFGVGKQSEFYLELDDASVGSANDADSDAQPAAPTSDRTEQAAPATATAEPKSVATTAPSTPKPVQPSVPAVTSFASDYLGGTGGVTMRRRRPGPSLSPFMDLARQVKTPSKAR